MSKTFKQLRNQPSTESTDSKVVVSEIAYPMTRSEWQRHVQSGDGRVKNGEKILRQHDPHTGATVLIPVRTTLEEVKMAKHQYTPPQEHVEHIKKLGFKHEPYTQSLDQKAENSFSSPSRDHYASVTQHLRDQGYSQDSKFRTKFGHHTNWTSSDKKHHVQVATEKVGRFAGTQVHFRSNVHWESNLNEETQSGYKVGDHVLAKMGPHKGELHRVIHVHDTGHVNITPVHSVGRRNRYHLGAVRAHPEQVERATLKEWGDDKALYFKPGEITREIADELTKMKPKAAKKPKKLQNRKVVREAFEKGKEKLKEQPPKDTRANEKDLREPKDIVTDKVPQQDDNKQFGMNQAKPVKKDNRPKPEKADKIEVKGPGADDKFQPEPVVTPITTMATTTDPGMGSKG